MCLVIDTNIFIDVENGRISPELFDTVSGEAYIAAVTASELLTGVLLAQSTSVRIRRSAFVEGILSQLPVIDFNEDVARTYAELYAYFLKKRNRPTNNVHDLQIAATAITYGHSVLTNHLNDFKKIPGLMLEGL